MNDLIPVVLAEDSLWSGFSGIILVVLLLFVVFVAVSYYRR